MIAALHGALDAHRRQPRPARRAARRAKGRTSASARASRSTCPSAAPRCWPRCTRCSSAMLEFPGPILVARARPVPGRRPRARAGRQPDLRRAGRAVRPARNQARRVRAGGVGAAAVSHNPAGGRGPALLGPLDQRRRGRWRCGLVQALAEDPAAAALAWFEQHLQDKSAAALACALTRRARRTLRRRARAPRRSRTAVPRDR